MFGFHRKRWTQMFCSIWRTVWKWRRNTVQLWGRWFSLFSHILFLLPAKEAGWENWFSLIWLEFREMDACVGGRGQRSGVRSWCPGTPPSWRASSSLWGWWVGRRGYGPSTLTSASAWLEGTGETTPTFWEYVFNFSSTDWIVFVK